MTNKINAVNKNKSVADQVQEYLTQNVVNGTWIPGQKIPTESELCRLLNASRISVRAAIGKLVSVGILESMQGKGTFVCQNKVETALEGMYSTIVLNQSDRMNMLEFRKIIEISTAGLAAMRATKELVDKLADTIAVMEAAESPEAIVNSDLEFHYLLAKATGNSMIIKVFELLREAYLRMFEENVAQLGAKGAEYHRKILFSVEMRDSQMAERYMEEHLETTAKLTAEFEMV